MALGSVNSAEAAFQEMGAEFRADVFQLLSGHNALKRGFGWAFFVEPCPEVDEVPELRPLFRETLVEVTRRHNPEPGQQFAIPTVRVITNEGMELDPEEPWLWVTKDFLLGPIVCRYAVSTAHYFEDGTTDNPHAPILQPFEDGQVTIVNEARLPHVGSLDDGCAVAQLPDRAICPLGIFEDADEKIIALETGMKLLGPVVDIEPIYSGIYMN